MMCLQNDLDHVGRDIILYSNSNSLSLCLIPSWRGGGVTASIDSRKDHMHRGSGVYVEVWACMKVRRGTTDHSMHPTPTQSDDLSVSPHTYPCWLFVWKVLVMWPLCVCLFQGDARESAENTGRVASLPRQIYKCCCGT